MIRFIADEDFNNDILRGVRRRSAEVDIVRVQDVGVRQESDSVVLEFAASQGRAVLTHDVSTMTKFACQHLDAGLPMPGWIEVPRYAFMGEIIENIVLLALAGDQSEVENQIRYLPL